MNIKDTVVVITGGAQGLGAAMAERLGSQGAKLALIDINENSLKSAESKHLEQNHIAKGFVANIADENSVANVFEQIVKHFGRIDALINNAGITRDSLLIKIKDGKVVKTMGLQEWQQVINVNLTGVFLCGREAAQYMALQQSGVIINISSISKNGNVGQTNYTAAKAGVAAMTTTWAKELARYNVRAAAIAPGFIATEMTQAIKPEMLEKIKAGIPLRRMGQPDEIAKTVQFIIENDYISGKTIEVDGALTL